MRMTTEQRIAHLRETVDTIAAEIDAEVGKGRYEEAWGHAQALLQAVEYARGRTAAARSGVVHRYVSEDRRTVADVAERLGITPRWALVLNREGRKRAEEAAGEAKG